MNRVNTGSAGGDRERISSSPVNVDMHGFAVMMGREIDSQMDPGYQKS